MFLQLFRTSARDTNKHTRRAAGRLFHPRLEALEDRSVMSVTAPVETIREATGLVAADITATVAAFQADLGGANNGNTVGSQATGRRQITWDGADNDSAPARLPADFFNAVAPRGAIFGGDPRITFQVSADATPAVPGTLDEFGNLNATYPTAFAPFSSPRLFTSLTNNVLEVEFFVPGTLNRATVSGFGAVFTDVDVAGSTKIEFFDVNGQEIFERQVLATAGDASLSFLGVKFVGAPVAKVRITSGNAVVGPNDITQGGTGDIVVMDDFIYGEPQALRASRLVAGSDPGGSVRVLNADTRAVLANFQPYVGFLGAITVATGDVNGDGTDDIITGTGPGNPPHVKVFDGTSFAEIRSFFAFSPGFVSGVFVAAGNVNGDRFADIIVGAGPGAGPHVKVINGQTSTASLPNGQIAPSAELASFFAFAPNFSGGIYVGAGDINGDFRDDPLVGTASMTGHVKVFNAAQLTNVQATGQINASSELRSFLAYPGFIGGVFVAGGDVNGDGFVDLVTGTNTGVGHVKAFNGPDNAEVLSYLAFNGPGYNGGARVATGSFNDLDSIANVLTGQGPGGDSVVDINGLAFLDPSRFLPFGPGTLGLYVAGTRFSRAFGTG